MLNDGHKDISFNTISITVAAKQLLPLSSII